MNRIGYYFAVAFGLQTMIALATPALIHASPAATKQQPQIRVKTPAAGNQQVKSPRPVTQVKTPNPAIQQVKTPRPEVQPVKSVPTKPQVSLGAASQARPGAMLVPSKPASPHVLQASNYSPAHIKGQIVPTADPQQSGNATRASATGREPATGRGGQGRTDCAKLPPATDTTGGNTETDTTTTDPTSTDASTTDTTTTGCCRTKCNGKNRKDCHNGNNGNGTDGMGSGGGGTGGGGTDGMGGGGNVGGGGGQEVVNAVGRHGPYIRIDRANEVAAYYRSLGYNATIAYLGSYDDGSRTYAVDVTTRP